MDCQQGMDPSHGPFLHHGLAGLKIQDNQPMPAEPLPLSKVRGRGWFWVAWCRPAAAVAAQVPFYPCTINQIAAVWVACW